jgi:hypothetical protein
MDSTDRNSKSFTCANVAFISSCSTLVRLDVEELCSRGGGSSSQTEDAPNCFDLAFDLAIIEFLRFTRRFKGLENSSRQAGHVKVVRVFLTIIDAF